MGTPQAVQDQIDEANRIQEAISGSKTEGEQDNANKSPEPAKTTDNPVKAGNESIEQLKAKLEQLDTRFKSYKKMYDKEVSGSRVELQKKSDEITQLKTEIERLKAEASEKPGKNDDRETSETLEEISEKFGDEFVDAVSDLSKSQLMRENVKLLARIDNIEKRLDQKSTEQLADNESANEPTDAGYSFESRLKDLVPDWVQINGSIEFKEWLDGADKDGQRRQDNLVIAHKAGNAIRVAELFYEFKDAQFSHRESTGEYLPDGLNGGERDVSEEIITQDYINKFYHDKALGRFTPDEAAKREAKINAAMETGSIR